MKRSIAWHQERLECLRIHLEEQRRELEAKIGYVHKLTLEMYLKSNQISKAVAQGRTEFDGKRFGVPRKKPVAR